MRYICNALPQTLAITMVTEFRVFGKQLTVFFRLYVIGNDFAGLLPPDKEGEKADIWCPKSHSLELSNDI